MIVLDDPASGFNPVGPKLLFGELERRAALGAPALLSGHSSAQVEECRSRKDGTVLAVTDLGKDMARHKAIGAVGARGCCKRFSL